MDQIINRHRQSLALFVNWVAGFTVIFSLIGFLLYTTQMINRDNYYQVILAYYALFCLYAYAATGLLYRNGWFAILFRFILSLLSLVVFQWQSANSSISQNNTINSLISCLLLVILVLALIRLRITAWLSAGLSILLTLYQAVIFISELSADIRYIFPESSNMKVISLILAGRFNALAGLLILAGYAAVALLTIKSDVRPPDISSVFPGKSRSSRLGIMILVILVTGPAFYCFWPYRTMKWLKAQRGDSSSCIGEMLLLLFIPFYSIYWFYKYANVLWQIYADRQIRIEKFTVIVTIFAIFFPLISIVILSGKLLDLDESAGLNQSRHKVEPDDISGKLVQLKDLLDKGLISEQEYTVKRQEILERL